MQEKSTELQMQKELDAYKSNNSTAKSYFTSMKEISSWLTSKEK